MTIGGGAGRPGLAVEMAIERDVAVPMGDGVVLRADVFRPVSGGPWPVIMSLGPYGKSLPFAEGVFAARYERLLSERPEVLEGSSGAQLNWETVDPEQWIPAGYAVVRVDSRGAGRSPGRMDLLSRREVADYVEAIEWAGTRPWSNGRVGLAGVSYYAMNQWLVAAQRPAHLAAIVPWEGAADHYRDMTHHGGIFSSGFFAGWYPRQVLSVQHGRGADGPTSPWVPDGLGAGPETLTDDELAANRTDYLGELRRRPLDDDWYAERTADLSRIDVPLLSAANWGGLGLHSRGNFEGYARAATASKWLDVHTGRHEEEFYCASGRALQRAFFDRFLLGRDNGWEDRAPVTYAVRHADGRLTSGSAKEWPIEGTRWARWHCDAAGALHDEAQGAPEEAASVRFGARGDGVTLWSPPLPAPLRLVGPVAAQLFVATSGSDGDLFCTLRAFGPDGEEVDFQGANDPRAPLSQGWLRLSHRALDPDRSTPWRPWHPHRVLEEVQPGTAYRADVELWPTCIDLPAGFRLALTVGGSDFARPDAEGPFRGSGPFTHDDPEDRRHSAGVTLELFTGGRTPSHLLLPVIGRR